MGVKIIITEDGSSTVFSEQFGVTYHSKFGAIQESMYVFIKNGLFAKSAQNKDLSILEVGMGTGLNTLLTFIESFKYLLNIKYTAIEAFPLEGEHVNELNYTSHLGPVYEAVFQNIHNSEWGVSVPLSETFALTKLKISAEEFEASNEYDIIYYDAFAPQAQPLFWEKPMMTNMLNALKPNGFLVTYCAKGDFKRCLKELGFQVESLEGPPGKREMTRATKI